MSRIALKLRGAGDVALAYKNDDLHILDPFLLFYLRHDTWSVEKDLSEPVDEEQLPEIDLT